MTRNLSRSKSDHAPRKASAKRRRVTRGNLKLLTAFRCLDAGKESHTGFVRALKLSPTGALLESPDEFALDQMLSLEFLLDNNRIAQADGRVTRVTQRAKFYRVAVEFGKLSPNARRLIKLQVAA
jgi:hypothetical protein